METYARHWYLIFQAGGIVWKESCFTRFTCTPFGHANKKSDETIRIRSQSILCSVSINPTRWWNSRTVQVRRFCHSLRMLLRFIMWTRLGLHIYRGVNFSIVFFVGLSTFTLVLHLSQFYPSHFILDLFVAFYSRRVSSDLLKNIFLHYFTNKLKWENLSLDFLFLSLSFSLSLSLSFSFAVTKSNNYSRRKTNRL